MLNRLKSKIIIYFAIFGAVFSFFLAVFSGVSVFWLIIRIIAGGILMGSLGFGLDFFLRQSLSEEDYQSLFQKQTSEIPDSGPVRTNNIDVTDNTGLPSENEYKNLYQQNPDMKSPRNSSSELPDEQPAIPANETIYTPQEQTGQKLNDTPVPPIKMDAFNPDSIESIPKISKKVFDDNMNDSLDSDNKPQSELSKMENAKREEKNKKPFSVNPNADSSVEFKVGKKKITADPKIIAKAIRTVIQRDK